MNNRDRTSGWVSAVLRDYGLEAWDDNEPDLRRDAEFVVLDPEALANRCAFLRSLGATAGARRWAVEEVSLRGIHGASPEAIRAVMADPAALCDVHFSAWTTTGRPWAEAMTRYRSNQNAPTPQPETITIWRSRPKSRSAAAASPKSRSAAAASDDEIIEHNITLCGDSLRAEVQGTIQLRRTRGDGQPDSWWLMLRFRHYSEQSSGRPGDATAEYRNQIVTLEFPDRVGGISRLEVLLHINDQGELISDRYFLKDIDPTRKGFDFTLSLDPVARRAAPNGQSPAL
jgi:hypothetical protein